MKALLHRVIDHLQAKLPPNRIVVLLGGLLTAVSATVSAWLAAHFPGLDLGAPEIAGVLGAAALITIRLLDRWLDQWQRNEPIDFEGDIEDLADDLDPLPPGLRRAVVGVETLEDLGVAMTETRQHVEGGGVQMATIVERLDAFGATLAQFLRDQPDPEAAFAPEESQSPGAV
jgi:hypothetical protein